MKVSSAILTALVLILNLGCSDPAPVVPEFDPEYRMYSYIEYTPAGAEEWEPFVEEGDVIAYFTPFVWYEGWTGEEEEINDEGQIVVDWNAASTIELEEGDILLFKPGGAVKRVVGSTYEGNNTWILSWDTGTVDRPSGEIIRIRMTEVDKSSYTLPFTL